MKRSEIKKMEETITSYDTTVKTKGIQALSMEDIEKYRTALKNKAERINTSIFANRLINGLLGTGAVLKTVATIQDARDYYVAHSSAIGDEITIPYTMVVGVLFGLLVGMNIEQNWRSKKDKKAIEEQVIYINEEEYARTR